MGAIGFFSDYEYNPCEKTQYVVEKGINSTPDPTNFVIRHKEIINGYPLLIVQYPDVLNYEGIKILLFPKNFDLTLIEKKIDPHFSKEKTTPIARFIPNEEGIKMAKLLAKKLP